MEAPSSITAAKHAETEGLKDSYEHQSIERQKAYTLDYGGCGCILFVYWLDSVILGKSKLLPQN